MPTLRFWIVSLIKITLQRTTVSKRSDLALKMHQQWLCQKLAKFRWLDLIPLTLCHPQLHLLQPSMLLINKLRASRAKARCSATISSRTWASKKVWWSRNRGQALRATLPPVHSLLILLASKEAHRQRLMGAKPSSKSWQARLSKWARWEQTNRKEPNHYKWKKEPKITFTWNSNFSKTIDQSMVQKTEATLWWRRTQWVDKTKMPSSKCNSNIGKTILLSSIAPKY